jgi:hypothetical protein
MNRQTLDGEDFDRLKARVLAILRAAVAPLSMLDIKVALATEEMGPLLTSKALYRCEQLRWGVRDSVWELIHDGTAEFTPRRYVVATKIAIAPASAEKINGE